MRMLFIHHSTGANLIREGHIRALLQERIPILDFWDHSYNLYPGLPLFLAPLTHHSGLTDDNGHLCGTDYDIVLSNNSPKEYAEIFSRDRGDSTLSKILAYDVIAFKNCYPTTKIISDEQLSEDKNYYESIRENLKKYSAKKWIIFTPPPLRKELTTATYGSRARLLTNWLSSREYLDDAKNIYIFNFFDLLANKNNFLREEYCRLISLDSHPNRRANEEVGKAFVDFLIQALKA